jgi:predicted ATPase
MITRLYVDNFRCLVNFELKLQDLTLLAGLNGSGKSSALDVVFALQRLLSGEAKVNDAHVLPDASRTRWYDRDTQVVELTALVGGDEMRYRLKVQHESGGRKARIVEERLLAAEGPLFVFEDGDVQLFRDDLSTGPKFAADWSESALARVPPRHDNRRLTAFLDVARRLQVCRLNPASFCNDSPHEEPMLRREGANFSSWYRHLVQEHGDSFEYRTVLQKTIDDFQKLRLEKVGAEARTLLAVFGTGKEEYELRLEELSDGQRVLLVLYGLLHFLNKSGYLLFVDEPDNFLAASEIQPWLLAAEDAIGEGLPQVVIASHHAEVIDYLGGDRGILFEREVTGVTKTRPLRDLGIPDAMKLSEVLARGWER